MITLTSFHLKWMERLILYHINEENNEQAKLSALQYGFRAGVSTEIALHKFVRCVSSSSSSSSNLFQSQRSLKSQLKQKQSMLTIIFAGNREEAK